MVSFAADMKGLKDGFTGARSIVLPQMIVEMEERDPLVSSLYITDIGYYPHAVGHHRERREGIDQHVLIYCVEGAGRYRLDGRSYDVHSGEYFILPAGHPHAYTADDDNPWTIYWIHFKGQHAAVYAEGKTEEYCLTVDEHDYITGVTIGGHDAWFMSGHVYFDHDFSVKFRDLLKAD